MNKNKQNSLHVLRMIADHDIPGNSIDLWPDIRSQMLSTRKPILPGLSRQFATVVVSVVVVVGLLVAVPTARGMIETMWQRLGLLFVDTDQYNQELEPQEPNALRIMLEPETIAMSDVDPSLLSISEIQELVPFDVRFPLHVPDGLMLIGGTVAETDNGMQVSFEFHFADKPFDSPELSLIIGPVAPFLVPSSRGQEVVVNGLPATYVHGGWSDTGHGDPETILGNKQDGLAWDDAINDAYLSWEGDDGLSYLLFAQGLGLELEDMLQIAESIE